MANIEDAVLVVDYVRRIAMYAAVTVPELVEDQAAVKDAVTLGLGVSLAEKATTEEGVSFGLSVVLEDSATTIVDVVASLGTTANSNAGVADQVVMSLASAIEDEAGVVANADGVRYTIRPESPSYGFLGYLYNENQLN